MKVEKTYSDVEGQPDLIECDICQERLRRRPRWVITNHNRRKHGLGRFLCGSVNHNLMIKDTKNGLVRLLTASLHC